MMTREELNNSISMIARNAARLNQLSEDILDVTKIESHSLNLRKEVCDLNDILRNSIEEYKKMVIQSDTPFQTTFVFCPCIIQAASLQ
jgi:K+-sensing histidine kinase KdpD